MKRKRLLIALAAILALLLLAGGGTLFGLFWVGRLPFPQKQPTPKGNEFRVACVGDSLTYGFGVPNHSQNSYPAVLAELLGDAACVHNYGVSGRTVSAEGDRPYFDTDEFNESLEFEPDIVVLALGSNDSKPFNWDLQKFTEGFNELIYAYKSLPTEPVVIVVLPPPVFEVNGKVAYSIDKNVLENEIVPAVEAIAEHYRLQTVDLRPVFEGRPDLFSDGCHPTKEGAALFAQEVAKAILGE